MEEGGEGFSETGYWGFGGGHVDVNADVVLDDGADDSGPSMGM
ncbi:hypothetical protein TIFTF001_004679 [Ficus carica]|uniref:Uncharacterized protein n=1 Tax=Ficus carica TaxID=3494 RepID=A0AA87ZZ37_FICCA|nr:hypothetical protein TIFTF001_004679 [Ficus carica]